jgi:hypothetical protein
MVIRLVIDFGELVKVALKRGAGDKGWVGGGRGVEAAGFCGPYVCLVYFCCSGGCLCQGLQGLGLCTAGTVGQAAGGECIGGKVVW